MLSELSPRPLKKTLKQVPGRQNDPTSQGKDTNKAQAATKVSASNKRQHNSGGRTAMAAPTRKHDGDSCSNIAHNKARKVAPTEPEGKKAGDKLQKLFGDFKSLGRHQVRDMGDEEALECYCKIRSEELD